MGIDSTLAYFLGRTAQRFQPAGVLCTLGVQDIRSTSAHLERVLSAAGVEASVDEPRDLYAALGFDRVESIDVSDYEGCSHLCDLNEPGVPPHLVERFNAVYNGGTLEHVFDIRTALRNIFELLKVGGLAIHVVPTSGWIDHGFYQFSPTLLTDYYGVNGFEVLEVTLLEPVGVAPEAYIARPYIADSDVRAHADVFSGRWLTYVTVRKREDSTWDRVPRQRYYASIHLDADAPTLELTYRPPFRIEDGIPVSTWKQRHALPEPQPGAGFEWVVRVPQLRALADGPHLTQSPLVLFEDGEPIGPGHALHADIRRRGRGRYSHWEDAVRFSTTRNDDPRQHVYTYALEGLTGVGGEGRAASTCAHLNRLVRWSL